MITQRFTTRIALGATLAATTLTMAAVHAERWKSVGEFEYATIIVERNATDGDTEIVITAKPLTDFGLKSFSVLSPHWRKVADVDAPARSRGVREFLLETPEPAGSQILATYPRSRFRGRRSRMLLSTSSNSRTRAPIPNSRSRQA